MKIFEIFEKIIDGDLRPHNYKSNGKLLKEKIQKLEMSDEDRANYWKYGDRLKNKVEVLDENADFYLPTDLLVTEIRNDGIEELMDIEIPPPPDTKGEAYLDLIEFEYKRNAILIDEYFNNNAENSFRKYAALNIQNLRIMWDEIQWYKKLVIKGKELDYKNSNDYVIFLLEVFLERIIYYLLELFSPYVENGFIKETMVFLSSERVEETKKLENARLYIMAKKYKENIGTNLPCSVSSFELEREEISKLSNINDRLIRYRDYLTFWKGAILSKSMLSGDNEIKNRIIPLIENEIENLEYKLSLSTSTENDGKGIVEETETAEDLVDENSRFNLTEEVNEFAYLKDRMKLFPKSTTQNTPFQKSNIYSMIYWLGNKNQLVDLSRKLVEYEFISKEEKKLFIGIFSYSKKQSLSQPREAKDKVQWQDTDTLFTYLFVKLVGSGLLKKDFLYPTGGGWSILTKYFLNKKGNQLNNRQLANTAQNYARNKNMKPKRSENIDSIVDEVAATKKTM